MVVVGLVDWALRNVLTRAIRSTLPLQWKTTVKLTILGVTVTNSLSVAVQHVQDIIKLSSQTLKALRIVRSHGMSATVIQHVFRAVVVAKLSYTSQAWLRFTSAADLQRINAFLCRCIHQGFCSPDLHVTDITVFFDAADETFRKILSDVNHLLAPLLLVKFAHPTTLDLGAIIGSLLLKSTNCVIAISSSTCCIKTRTDWLLYQLYYFTCWAEFYCTVCCL